VQLRSQGVQVGGWDVRVEVKDGEAVGVWVKKDVHPLTTQPIYFTQDEQEDRGKANYLGDLQ